MGDITHEHKFFAPSSKCSICGIDYHVMRAKERQTEMQREQMRWMQTIMDLQDSEIRKLQAQQAGLMQKLEEISEWPVVIQIRCGPS